MFAKVDGVFIIRLAGKLSIGDYLIRVLPDGSYVEEEIAEITSVNTGDRPVYVYSAAPHPWYVAGEYLVHNVKI